MTEPGDGTGPAGDDHHSDGVSPADAEVPPDQPAAELLVESLLDDVERLTHERDEALDARLRTQADFENYRKRMMKQQADQAEHAASRLVEDLLPVLDACDGAVLHGAAAVEPVFAALLGTLEKNGLERMDPLGEAFDPNRHDAVLHEPADDSDDGTVVADVMRRGYAWKGRVIRPAMVKVRG